MIYLLKKIRFSFKTIIYSHFKIFQLPLAIPLPLPILKPYDNSNHYKSLRIRKDFIKMVKKMLEYENIPPK